MKQVKHRRTTILLSIFLLSVCGHVNPPAQAEDFPDIRKIMCVGRVDGCPCYKDNSKGEVAFQVHHMESVVKKSTSAGLGLIHTDKGQCYFPEKDLLISQYDKVLRSNFQSRDHSPISLKNLVNTNGRDLNNLLANARKLSMGKFWPTYYHLALEDHHPGPKVNVLSPQGKVITQASQEFLRQVRWEGSGITSGGIRLQYDLRTKRYIEYNSKYWGFGAGQGYMISPYRTIAVHRRGICEKLKGSFPGCNVSKIQGVMVYSPTIAEKKIKMADGSIHDGYMCMTDTGDPYFIRPDRVDIFVGTHGGGNPYLPKGRQWNHFIEGGIQNIVPSDWKLWKSEKLRVFCDISKLPKDLENPQPNDCAHDYHYVARQKALEFYALFDSANKPIYCNKKLVD